MKKLVFLGGTCGNNNWRKGFIEALVSRGLPQGVLFNPVVEHWDEEAQRQEEEVKAKASHLVFYIADPKMDSGDTLSAYSMVEATMALYDKPERSVVIFDTAGIIGRSLKAMEQTMRVLKVRFPDGNIFTARQAALDWLVKQLA